MRKHTWGRVLALCLTLASLCALLPGAAAAEQALSFSAKTCVYSISKEKFVRDATALASPDECGKDEYITLSIQVKNGSKEAVTLSKPCVSIDGGEKLYWTDGALKAGGEAAYHVFHTNQRFLTPGLHTAVFYASGKALYSCRFNIGRAWSKSFRLPTEAQIAARPADRRSPYLAMWLKNGRDVQFDAYCVDFKSDHIPNGCYNAVFNGYMEFSSAENQNVSAPNNNTISLYGGLQKGDEGRESNFILSFWDIHCTGKDGKETVIRPKRTFPAEATDNDSFTGEGEGAHTQLPYEWKEGRWYRMLLQCGVSKTTGNTTVEQWFQDLTTGQWTHACTYDLGLKNCRFRGSVALFSENFLPKYAGEVRSLEFTNVRIQTSEGWKDLTSTDNITSRVDETGVLSGIYGSWDAGADANTFYMISTGVAGWGRKESTGPLTIKNRETGDPLKSTVGAAAKPKQ